MPCRIASRGDSDAQALRPPRRTVPDVGRSAPKMARATSVRPAPISPAKPRISPRRSSKLTSSNTPSRDRPWTSSNSSAVGTRGARRELVVQRAADHRGDDLVDAGGGEVAGADVAAVAQHRDAVDDARHLVEPVRDVDDADALVARSSRITSNRRSVSLSVSDEVGSSMISTSASSDSALAISTICCCADRQVRTGAAGSISTPSRVEARCASARSRVRSTNGPRCGSRARKMFSATDRWGTRFSSWWIIAIPRVCASSACANRRGAPFETIRPVVGLIWPLMIFISVDLPAPFSPHSACTSPRRSSKSTPSSASTPGKRFTIPRSERSALPVAGVASVAGGGGAPTGTSSDDSAVTTTSSLRP